MRASAKTPRIFRFVVTREIKLEAVHYFVENELSMTSLSGSDESYTQRSQLKTLGRTIEIRISILRVHEYLVICDAALRNSQMSGGVIHVGRVFFPQVDQPRNS
jgi:hypothetical protein